MNRSPDEPTVDLWVAEVVQTWIEQREQEGKTPTAAELIDMHPELAPQLAECLAGLKLVDAGSSGFFSDDDPANPRAGFAGTFPQIPDFEILGELGRGGMGVVYEAKQHSLDRIVALKVLPIGTIDPQAIDRFSREAETAATLHHTNIVPIHAVGRSEGFHWYAMQRIEGQSLAGQAVGRDAPMPVDDLVRIGIDAAEALAHAHARGVVHRDIKPGNLLIDSQQRVWLTDFGLARREMDVTATATGAVMGTPRYMSPEQTRGEVGVVDHRSDIYSLGATLYELSTGRPVFAADSPLTLLAKIQHDDPPTPRSWRPSLPRDLEVVLLKCLDKDPQRRYASAEQLADDLRAIRDSRPITARGLPWWVKGGRLWKRHQRQVRWVAAAVLGTIGTILALLLLWQQHREGSEGQLQIGAARGPYVASIAPVEGDASARESIDVTVPMQQPVTLPTGEYQVRLDGHGRFGETARVHVQAGQSTEVRYVDRRPPPATTDITDKLAVPLGPTSLAVLDDEALSVYDEEAKERYRLPLTELEPPSKSNESPDASAKPSTEQPRYGFDPDALFAGDWNVPRPLFARPIRLLPHLDEGILLIAERGTAMAAIRDDGQVRWRQEYSLPLNQRIPPGASRPDFPMQRFIDVAATGDLNGDQADDLVATAIHVNGTGVVQSFCLMLDGAEGDLLSIVTLPAIDTSKVKSWPAAGMLLAERGPYGKGRRTAHLMPTDVGSYARQFTEYPSGPQWFGGGRSSRLPVPTPIRQVQVDGRAMVALGTGRTVLLVDVQRGELIEKPLRLNSGLLDTPSVVRLDEAKTPGLLVLTVAPNSSGNESIRAAVYRVGEDKPLWIEVIPCRWEVRQETSSAPNVPLIDDLDGDGVDEVVFSTGATGWRDQPQLTCLDAATGNSEWTESATMFGIARSPERCTVIDDIDNDGVKDLAVAGIAALSPRNLATNLEMSLFIDVVSGGTGTSCGWQSQRLPNLAGRPPVAEIDESIYDPAAGTLEVSIVYGEVTEEELASATVRFDLRGSRRRAMAIGLTAFHSEPTSAAAYFRRRSGRDAIDSAAAVWLDRSAADHWLGVEDVLGRYEVVGDEETIDTRMVLADAASLFVVDAASHRTQWKRTDLSDRRGDAFSLPRKDGAVDLLVQRNAYLSAEALVLNGGNGRTRFRLDDAPTGTIDSLVISRQKPFQWFYAMALTEYQGARQANNPAGNAYWLMKVDRASGSVLWRRGFSPDVRSPNRSMRPSLPVEIDANGDDTADVLCGDYSQKILSLIAYDGNDGEPLWALPLHQQLRYFPNRRHWPLYQRLFVSGKERVLVLDTTADRQSYSLRLIDPQSGSPLAELPISGDLTSLEYYAGEAGNISLCVVAEEDDNVVVGVVVPRQIARVGRSSVWNAIEVSSDGLRKIHEDVYEHLWRVEVIDIDDDGVAERIAYQDRRGECRDPLSDQLRWSFAAGEDWQFGERSEHRGGHWLMARDEQRDGFRWLDLRQGKIAYSLSRRHGMWHDGEQRYPALIPTAAGMQAIGRTRDGVYTVPLEPAAETAAAATSDAALRSPARDRRRVVALPVLGQPVNDLFWQLIRSMLLASLGLVLPLAYLGYPLRRRRWSLAWLMLAPAVTLVALFAWRSLFAGSAQIAEGVAQLIGGTIACAGFLGLLQLLREQRWRLLAVAAVTSAAGAALIIGFALAQNRLVHPAMQFYTTPPQLVFVWAMVLMNVGLVFALASRLGRRLRAKHSLQTRRAIVS